MLCEATMEALAMAEWRKENASDNEEASSEEEEDEHQRVSYRCRVRH
jgi:hypothetical protein